MSWMRKLDKDVAIQEITKKFDDFLTASKAIVCPLASVSIEKLFSDYDAEHPPFGADQKKDQFPDAAAMLCLAAWCKSNSKHAYVY